MKIRTNVRAGYTTYDRCGGATRCGGTSRCGGSSDDGGYYDRRLYDTAI